ncbi:MAG: hypothetical protein ACOZHQ_11515 [Thermodesulfobacteriota bacterium]
MDNTHYVRTPKFPFNMASWCSEKSQSVLFTFTTLLSMINRCTDLNQETREYLQAIISGGIWNGSKLLALSCGADWQPMDADDIFGKGREGLENILVEYGLLSETSQDRIKWNILQFYISIEALVDGPRVPNRTLLHALLAKRELDHSGVTLISELLEKVTMGDLDWDKFVEEAKIIINHVKTDLDTIY